MPPLALALVGALIWSSAFAATKFGLASCPPFLFLVIRFLGAGGAMLAWAARRGIRSSPRELAMLACLGLLNFGAFLALTTLALATVPSAIIAAIIGLNPVVTVAAGALILRERPGVDGLAALLLGLAGVLVVTGPRALAAGGGGAAGYAMTVGGLVMLALGTVLFRRFGTRAEPVLANAMQNLGAGVALIPLSLATEHWGTLSLTLAFVASEAWVIGVVSIIGYLIWFRMLRTGSLTAAAVAQFLLPPAGLAYGALLHGETLAMTDLLGLAPILGALALVNRRQRARKATSSADITPHTIVGPERQ